MINIEKRGGLWWPVRDYHCYNAVIYEVENINHMLSFCKGLRRVAVQAGGNCGLFPIELAKHFEKVFTFEPDPENYACLEANVKGNERIYPIPSGLGEEKELVELCRDQSNCGAYYVQGNGTIQIVELDRYDFSDCNFLQLDIEGYEYRALRGAIETIKRCRPVIVCEEKGLGDKYGVERDDITTFLATFHYSVADKIGNDVIYIPN